MEKKKQMQLHARLWRGTIAIRMRKINAGRKLKRYLKVRNHRWSKLLSCLTRVLAPMQQELAALEKQEREQAASMHMWWDSLTNEEAMTFFSQLVVVANPGAA